MAFVIFCENVSMLRESQAHAIEAARLFNAIGRIRRPFSLHSGTMAPGAGAPLHVHTREDETFYVLAGEVEAIAGDERQILRTGDCIFLPRAVPHSLHNVSPNRLKY